MNNITFTMTGHQRWGLQAAIVEQFNQFLDKTETLNKWSRGLYYPRDPETNQKPPINDQLCHQ